MFIMEISLYAKTVYDGTGSKNSGYASGESHSHKETVIHTLRYSEEYIRQLKSNPRSPFQAMSWGLATSYYLNR